MESLCRFLDVRTAEGFCHKASSPLTKFQSNAILKRCLLATEAAWLGLDEGVIMRLG